MSLMSTILAAAEHTTEHEKSELPFFLIGGCLALFAVVISVIGFKRPDFPGSAAAARGVMGLGVTLVLATMAAIVYVSN
jgi:hypothetical protein